MKKFIGSFVVAGIIAGCGGAGGESEYIELVARTENEIKLAAQTGFLWLNTEGLLRESKSAQAAGDTNKAFKLAKQALDEAVLAQRQARASAKPDFSFKP